MVAWEVMVNCSQLVRLCGSGIRTDAHTGLGKRRSRSMKGRAVGSKQYYSRSSNGILSQVRSFGRALKIPLCTIFGLLAIWYTSILVLVRLCFPGTYSSFHLRQLVRFVVRPSILAFCVLLSLCTLCTSAHLPPYYSLA